MKHLKIFETLTTKETIKNIIKNYINDEIYVELDKYYTNDGDKIYDLIINKDSIVNASKKLTDFMFKILQLENDVYDDCYILIKSLLNDIEIDGDEDLEKLDKYSVDSVTDDIYDYMNDYSNYKLNKKFKFINDVKNFNL